MGISVIQSEFHGWQGYRLSVGDVSVGVAPDIGGRIISLTYHGEELLFVQKEHAGETFDFCAVTDLCEEKRRLGFRLWGGDKTWISPQVSWLEAIPPLELDCGKYETRIEKSRVSMRSPQCRETGLIVERSVEVWNDGTIVLDQTLTNKGTEPARKGIWDVTQCKRPLDVYFHMPKKALRPYPREGDSVNLYDSVVSEEGGWVKVSCDRPAHFKYGGLADRGVVVALRRALGETLAFVRYFFNDPGELYAHGSSVEVYNSPQYDYLEIEVHAPLVQLLPGGYTSHRQVWRVGREKGLLGPNDVEKMMGEQVFEMPPDE